MVFEMILGRGMACPCPPGAGPERQPRQTLLFKDFKASIDQGLFEVSVMVCCGSAHGRSIDDDISRVNIPDRSAAWP